MRCLKKFACGNIDKPDVSCDAFSIWSRYGKCDFPAIKTVGNALSALSPCHPYTFPVVYWAVLLLSIIGTIFSTWELLSILMRNPANPIRTYRKRYFHKISPTVRRNARLVGSFLMAKAYFWLFIGIITVSPSLMKFWLRIQMVCFGAELLLWIFEILTKDDVLSLANILSYAILLYSWLMVNCVKNVFQDAIETNDFENLILSQFVTNILY